MPLHKKGALLLLYFAKLRTVFDHKETDDTEQVGRRITKPFFYSIRMAKKGEAFAFAAVPDTWAIFHPALWKLGFSSATAQYQKGKKMADSLHKGPSCLPF